MGGDIRCLGGKFLRSAWGWDQRRKASPSRRKRHRHCHRSPAASHHTCALLISGSIDCWGDNDEGQIGDGTNENSSTPVAVSGITDAAAITAGGDHTCALLAGGGIDSWGENRVGELGNGKTSNSDVPVTVNEIE